MKAWDFDAIYEEKPDPWGYLSSPYEREKYAATLAACGPGPFTAALELGGSIGVFTRQLAPRCESLISIDFSSVAVEQARAVLSEFPHVEARIGEVPEAIPEGPHDLIVASEILYYLSPEALEGTITALHAALAHGGRLVVVHWRPTGPERAFSAAEVHARVAQEPWLELTLDAGSEDYMLQVFTRGVRE